jgi:hypothetical protein
MPLVPLTFYTTLYDAIAKSAAEAMVLYNRSLDPKDNVVVQVDTPFGIEVPINLNTARGNKTVDLEKASEVFGKALAVKLAPVLVNNIDRYIKSATITIPPGQVVVAAGASGGVTGATSAPSPPAIIA